MSDKVDGWSNISNLSDIWLNTDNLVHKHFCLATRQYSHILQKCLLILNSKSWIVFFRMIILNIIRSNEIVQIIGILTPGWIWMYMYHKLQTIRRYVISGFRLIKRNIYKKNLRESVDSFEKSLRNYIFKNRISWNSWGKSFAIGLKKLIIATT